MRFYGAICDIKRFIRDNASGFIACGIIAVVTAAIAITAGVRLDCVNDYFEQKGGIFIVWVRGDCGDRIGGDFRVRFRVFLFRFYRNIRICGGCVPRLHAGIFAYRRCDLLGNKIGFVRNSGRCVFARATYNYLFLRRAVSGKRPKA